MPQITVTHYFISCIYNLFEAIFERKPIFLDPCDVMSYMLKRSREAVIEMGIYG